MKVLLFHPEWARSCTDCRTWMYNEDGRQSMRAGVPLRRPRGTLTPCHKCPKIPADAPRRAWWAAAGELSARNRQAYRHYRECRAVGVFPDDPIVRRNAALIRRVEEAFEREPLVQLNALLVLAPAKPAR